MSIIRASAKGDLPAVKKLVADGADVKVPDNSGRTAILEAAWGGYLDVVKYLVDKGADVNAADRSGVTPLMRAAEEGHAQIVSFLITKGANVHAKGSVKGTTALMLAAEQGHVKVLEVLLSKGAKINDIDRYEETALARAYRLSQTKAAQFLESKGGRGKPERSSYTSSGDRERSGKTPLPNWSAAAAESGMDDDRAESGESFEE